MCELNEITFVSPQNLFCHIFYFLYSLFRNNNQPCVDVGILFYFCGKLKGANMFAENKQEVKLL